MSEVQQALSDHLNAFKAALAKCQTRQDCVDLWRSNEKARADLCIIASSYFYIRLADLVADRLAEISERDAA